MRNNNRQLDEVCLDCLDNINPHENRDCKDCTIAILKQVNNKILNDEWNKEIKRGDLNGTYKKTSN
jgi:hypothetical protein